MTPMVDAFLKMVVILFHLANLPSVRKVIMTNRIRNTKMVLYFDHNPFRIPRALFSPLPSP